jgi:hypothetical protein
VKTKKNVIKDVLKPTSISPKSSFTDPNDPWSAKANVAENITSKRSDLLKQFYKSKGWNVNYITKNKRVSQSKTGDYDKWKRDHGIYEDDQIDEVSNELLGRYKSAAGSQASALDKAGGRENIQKANKRFSGIIKATKKQFANDDKKQGLTEGLMGHHFVRRGDPEAYLGKMREIHKTLVKGGYKPGGYASSRALSEPYQSAHYVHSTNPDTHPDVSVDRVGNQGHIHVSMKKSKPVNLPEQRVAEGLTEMDKSQTPPGRDGPPRPGPDKVAKPITAKKFKNHALSILQKSLQARDKKKDVKEAKDAGEYDYEGAMAKTQLQTICRNAEALRDMLDDDENLPEWVQAKITKAEDYITTSLDYLKSTDELEEEISLDEALSKNSTAYNWIHDFVHSDNPKFDGKSKAQRMQMALAAYYAMQKRSRTKNEGVGDPQAATQSPADGANGGEELAPPKKSIKRIVKEFHSTSRKVQEDLYDWEKDDKAAKPYGKKPTTQKIDGVNNIGDDKPNARLILKGGKTLTGEPRDTVELDPMMKNRSKMPDYKSMDKIKQKPQEQ